MKKDTYMPKERTKNKWVVGLPNRYERNLRLVGEICLEEEKVDGQSSANFQIAWVSDCV